MGECEGGVAPYEILKQFMDKKVVNAIDNGICTFTVHGRRMIRQV